VRRALVLHLALPLLFLSAASTALAAWPHDPGGNSLELRPSQTQCYGLVGIPDGTGGAFYAWDESSVIRAQHVDASGRLLWGANGVTVATAANYRYMPALCPDGAGGILVAWEDYRGGGTEDIYAQRVSAAGAPLWGAGGVAMCTAAGNQYSARIAADGAGGAVVAWLDGRSSLQRVFARAVNASGTPQWTADGVEVAIVATGGQAEMQILRMRSGRFALVWRDYRTDSGDLYLQLLDANGTRLLAASGSALCAATGVQSEPRLSLDNGLGCLVTWSDLRAGSSTDIYAQRINGSGNALWTGGGVAVCVNTSTQGTPAVTSDGSGGAFVAWTDSRNAGSAGTDIYAQHLSAAGAALWTVDGIAACGAAGNQSAPAIVADATGGACLAWVDTRGQDPGNTDVYGQRLSSSGSALWTSQGVAVSTGIRGADTGGVGFPGVVEDGRGGMIAHWTALTFNYSALLATAQRVDEWGYLGAEPVIASAKDVPSDQGGQVKLGWYASPLDTDPLFRNISGYWLYRSVAPNAALAAARRAGTAVATPAGAAGSATPPRYLQTSYGAQDYFWELALTVSATHLATYSEVVTTTGDSVGGSNPRTAFMVMARNSTGSMWWTSDPDSGYSVDNLAPAAPAPFTGQYGGGAAVLHWDPNGEPDLAGYELHRGPSAAFVPGPGNLVAALADTGYVDAAGAPFYYKLVAVDAHGNRSPASALRPAGTLGVEGGFAAAFLAPPSPNPSRGAVALRFGLAARGAVKLALYDAQGRLVRTLAEGSFEAGEHAFAFDGRDGTGRRLAPGLYLARLVAPGIAASRRIVVTD